MKVELLYFKESGKYYSNGEYDSKETMFHRIIEEVYDMLMEGNNPGLYDRAVLRDKFDTYVTTPDGPPHLIRYANLLKHQGDEP